LASKKVQGKRKKMKMMARSRCIKQDYRRRKSRRLQPKWHQSFKLLLRNFLK
jgi:hypothetical protein